MLVYEDLLSETERLLWERVLTGEWVDAADDDPSVRGELLVELATTERRPDGGRACALRLRGARVTGSADFQARTLVCPLTVEDSDFDEAIVLDESVAVAVRLQDSRLPAVRARQLETRGDFELDGVEVGQVVLSGACIGGVLSLIDAVVSGDDGLAINAERVEVHQRAEFSRLKATGETVLFGAHIRGQLDFIGAELSNPGGTALSADGVTVDQDLFCREGFTAEGEVRLLGVEIGGHLDMRGARLKHPGGACLSLDTAHVAQNVVCRDGFSAEGEVRLLGARIDGQVDLRGAQLANSGAPAFDADGARIGGYLLCRDGFTAIGEVDLRWAHIGGLLDLSDARLENPEDGALTAYGLEVERDVICRGDFTAHGEIRLNGARIGGGLDFGGATLSGSPRAIHAAAAHIGGSVSCGAGFTADGEVSFLNAQIAGEVVFSGATLRNPGALALDLEGARIERSLLCIGACAISGGVDLLRAQVAGDLSLDGLWAAEDQDPATTLKLESASASELRLPAAPWRGQIDLTDARAGQLHDASWPAPGAGARPYTPQLSGFVYDSLGTESADLAARLDWIEHAEEDYLPQAYDQLVAVLRSMGREEDAREAAIAKHRMRRTQLKPHARVWSKFLDVTVGYGYRTWRAVYALLVVMVAGWGIFEWASQNDHIKALKNSDQLPDFAAWLYSIDSVLPVINLGHESAYAATGAAQYWYAFSVLSGWVLGTALIAALTAMLNRQ